MKRCNVCDRLLSETEFYKHKLRGLQYSCKKCQRKRGKETRKARSERERTKTPRKYWASKSIDSHKRLYKVEITTKWLTEYARKTNRCVICDRELLWDYSKKDGKVNPLSPSLDRVNNEHIITEKNCLLICNQCNTTKGTRSMDEFIDYCKNVVDRASIITDTIGEINDESKENS